jgi:hypothetical protein
MRFIFAALLLAAAVLAALPAYEMLARVGPGGHDRLLGVVLGMVSVIALLIGAMVANSGAAAEPEYSDNTGEADAD